MYHMEGDGTKKNNVGFPVYKIVISGGPCGGKSTSLKKIREEFSQKGFNVLSVPQIPTLVVQAGGMILMSKFDLQERIKFQSMLMKFQMYAEDYFTKLAEMSNSPSIVLCDRGVIDPYAYVSQDQFQAILDEEGWNWITLRDRRYDRAIFLTSAANGAEEFYTLINNVARSEGIELARTLDNKTLKAWTGHPHLTVIPNVKGETFEAKIDRVIEAVAKTVGLGTFSLNYEKYLIEKPIFPADLKFEESSIEETFLLNKDEKFQQDKIKKRGIGQSYTYQRKYRGKRHEDGNYMEEIRKKLSSLQYVLLKEDLKDPDFETNVRKRIDFTWDNKSYEIDIYNNILGEETVYILRYSPQKGKENLLPDFIKVIKDIKKDNKYSLREICRVKKE